MEGLKRFLEFARDGRIAVSSAQAKTDAHADIAEDIAAEVRKLGYTAYTHVGRSNFKIDIAVADPADEDTYLLGILCDGHNYYDTSTERDREITQPNVLRGLGWNLMKIWAVDWFMQRERCIQQLKSRIEELKNGEGVVGAAPANAKRTSKLSQLMHFDIAPDDIITEVENERELPYPQKSYPIRGTYCTLDTLKDKHITTLIKNIVATEQPVVLSVIARHIAKSYGIPRLTVSIINYIGEQADTVAWREPESPVDNPCYWTDDQQAEHYRYYRLSNGREPDEMTLAEVSNLVEYMVEQQVSTPYDNAFYAQVAKTLGYPRRNKKLDTLTAAAVQKLIEKGRIANNDSVLSKV